MYLQKCFHKNSSVSEFNSVRKYRSKTDELLLLNQFEVTRLKLIFE